MKTKPLTIGASAAAVLGGLALEEALARRKDQKRRPGNTGGGVLATLEDIPSTGEDLLKDLRSGVSSALGRSEDSDAADGETDEGTSLDEFAERRKAREERRRRRRSGGRPN